MPQNSELLNLAVDQLRISPLHEEIFRSFKRKYHVLKTNIRERGFDPSCALKVRKIRNGYEVLCGVGRMVVMLRLDDETRYADRASSRVPSRRVELTDREVVELILAENLSDCLSQTGFTEFQLYLLGSLHDSLTNRRASGALVKSKLQIGDTTLKSYRAAFKAIMTRLAELYPEFAAELKRRAAGNELDEQLLPLRLLNHAIEKKEWLELEALFAGKLAISVFYKKYCTRGLKPSAAECAGS